jgi:hypothetical protein
MTSARIIPFPNLASLAPTTDVSVTAEASSSSPGPVGASAVTSSFDDECAVLDAIFSLAPKFVRLPLSNPASDLTSLAPKIPVVADASVTTGFSFPVIDRNATTFLVAAESAIQFASRSSIIPST